MPKLLSRGIAAALLGSLCLTGCGGSGETTTPITKAELIKKADRICEKADDTEFEESVTYEQEHLKELTSLPSAKRILTLLRIVGFPSILKEGEELEALGAPAGE